MITIQIPDTASRPISQKNYDDIVMSLNLPDLPCPCGHKGGFIHHGSYTRRIKSPDGEFLLRICRVKCTFCGHTHAILLSSIVPFSQILLKDQVNIIISYEKKIGYQEILSSNLSIDESNIRSVISRYNVFWRNLVRPCHSVSVSLLSLTKYCFAVFKKQFMQIKDIPNLLFPIPT